MAAMNALMAWRVPSSPITSAVARGVAPLAAAPKADTMMPSENVVTDSMLLAITLLACFAGAALFERRLDAFRRVLRALAAYAQRRKTGVSDGVSVAFPARVRE